MVALRNLLVGGVLLATLVIASVGTVGAAGQRDGHTGPARTAVSDHRGSRDGGASALIASRAITASVTNLQTTNLTGTWLFTLSEPIGSVPVTVHLVDNVGVLSGSLTLPIPQYGTYNLCPVSIAGTHKYSSVTMTWTAGGYCQNEALNLTGLASATAASGIFTTSVPALPGGAWSASIE